MAKNSGARNVVSLVLATAGTMMLLIAFLRLVDHYYTLIVMWP